MHILDIILRYFLVGSLIIVFIALIGMGFYEYRRYKKNKTKSLTE